MGQHPEIAFRALAGPLPGRWSVAGCSRHLQDQRDAEAFLAATRADIERGTWISPEQGRIPLREYADKWLEQKKPSLRPRSQEQYETNLRLHIKPTLGDKDLSNSSTSTQPRTGRLRILVPKIALERMLESAGRAGS